VSANCPCLLDIGYIARSIDKEAKKEKADIPASVIVFSDAPSFDQYAG